MTSTFIDEFELPGGLAAQGGCCLGTVVAVTSAGRPLVDFPGNPGGPAEARSALDGCSASRDCCPEGATVLLWFENADLALPVILGIVRDTLPPPPAARAAGRAKQARQVVVDGQVLIFDAREEIVLRCGKSSLTLKKDGKVVVKGTHLVSRSSGVNKIKGATVAIN